jgi:hypothetical protein
MQETSCTMILFISGLSCGRGSYSDRPCLATLLGNDPLEPVRVQIVAANRES